jgi:hypothetical protein
VSIIGREFPANSQHLINQCEAFDAVSERVAISVLKLASWVTTIGVVLYGLWKSL